MNSKVSYKGQEGTTVKFSFRENEEIPMDILKHADPIGFNKRVKEEKLKSLDREARRLKRHIEMSKIALATLNKVREAIENDSNCICGQCETETKAEPQTEAKTEPQTEAKTEPQTEAKTETVKKPIIKVIEADTLEEALSIMAKDMESRISQ